MLVKSFAVGFLDTNCYLLTYEKASDALVIDPGFKENEAKKILEEIRKRSLMVKHIVNTHGHPDHVSGNGILKQATGASILIHENDASLLTNPSQNLSEILGLTTGSPPADRLLHDGDTVKIGQLELKVIHTPGHTMGSISLHCEDEDIVFTGDTLFAGSIGRTDLPGSSHKDIMRSLRRLMELPDQTVVYPGHGEETIIGREKQNNPFLLT